jgi:molecular chaperone GrpE
MAGEGGIEANSEGRPIIRDNRKIDPVSGRARQGKKPTARAAGAAGAAAGAGRSAAGGAAGNGAAGGAAGNGAAGGAAGNGAAGGAGTAQAGTGAAGDSAAGGAAGDGGTASAREAAARAQGNYAPTPGTAEVASRALEDEVIAAAELISAREELAIRTEDLQRLGAEYANYRKRVDRDRAVAGDLARAEVLTALIPVLDDVDAARKAGDLEGPFKAVAEKLEATLERFGMERYGAEGEVFDPTIHEALLHQVSPDATEETISLVMQPGYRMGERVLRAARVGVVGREG